MDDPLYHEVREFCQNEFFIRFYFITRAYNDIVDTCIRDMQQEFKPGSFLFSPNYHFFRQLQKKTWLQAKNIYCQMTV